MGIESSDDSAVYRLDDGSAIVSTLDFFPPMVDDPYMFGQITAANALSDIYAMGAKPLFATNIVCFPSELPQDILIEILKGSADKLKEAGIVVAGGHSIEDTEVKYGVSVTGIIHPDKVITNKGANLDDCLVFTKPIGTGVIVSALKNDTIKEEDAIEALTSMCSLNETAASVMVDIGVSACTDVTGFGLIGHSLEMARGAGLSIELNSSNVGVFPKSLQLVKNKKNRPKSIKENSEYLKDEVVFDDNVSEEMRMIMFDPQTSGGLLIAVSSDKKEKLIEELKSKGVSAVAIGNFISADGNARIFVS